MERTIHPFAWCLVVFLLVALRPAFALEEMEIIDPLPPLDGPGERAIGWQWHYIDQNGNTGYMEKVDATEQNASYKRTDGCSWIRPVKGFAPAQAWANCPSSGTATVAFVSGDIWPLEVGNVFIWRYRGNSSLIGRGWQTQRQCEVLPSMRIRTVLGEFDVHKVECKERWGTRTWWLSHEAGTAIAYRQVTRRGTLLQEMTHIKP